MALKRNRATITLLTKKHRLPPSLIAYRLMIGFPESHIGATDLVGDTYFEREFMQQPFVDKKPEKRSSDKSHPPRYTPASPEDYGHIKVTRKPKPRF